MKILVPVDGSAQSREALGFAARRARRMAEVPAVKIVSAVPPLPAGAIDTVIELSAVKAALSEFAKRAIDAVRPAAVGVAAESEILFGRPGEAVAEAAEACDADLVVLGTRGRTGAKQLFFGSTASSVTAKCERPLLFVRTAQTRDPESLRILIAADGSHYAAAAAQFVVSHKDFFGPAPTVDVVSVLPDMEKWLEKNRSRGMEALVEQTRRCWDEEAQGLWLDAVNPALDVLKAARIPAQAKKLFGSAALEITRYAAESSDIILMGSHGRGRFYQALLGSTAAKVCAASGVPVLIVRGDKTTAES